MKTLNLNNTRANDDYLFEITAKLMRDAKRWRIELMVAVFFSFFSTGVLAALSVSLVDQLLASDGGAFEEDQFGFSVDVDGDRAVIGARFDNSANGSAYVYYNDPGLGWVEEQKLVMPGSTTENWFGHTVAIEGDVIVIGAPHYRSLETGFALVFTRDSVTGIWDSGVQLIPGTESTEKYGWSVAIDNSTVVVGEFLDPSQGIRTGAAHIFEFDALNTSWDRVAKLLPPVGVDHLNFGFSVAIDADTIVVGAPHATSGGIGTAYVFNRGGGWVNTTAGASEELPSDTTDIVAIDDYYGGAVAISGDLVVVGASFDDDAINGNRSGSITIIERSGGSWVVDEKLTASDGGEFDGFGSTVAVSGLIVGVGASNNGGNMGSFYLFAPTDTGWSEDVNKMATNTDRLGSSIALDASTLLVGATHLGKTGEGLVYDVAGSVVPPPLDLDIKSFTTSPKGVRLARPKEVVLTLKIKNNSQSTGSAIAMVTGIGAGVSFADSFEISDTPGGSVTSYIIPTGISPPTEPGIIIWDVTFEDEDADIDMATVETKVK